MLSVTHCTRGGGLNRRATTRCQLSSRGAPDNMCDLFYPTDARMRAILVDRVGQCYFEAGGAFRNASCAVGHMRCRALARAESTRVGILPIEGTAGELVQKPIPFSNRGNPATWLWATGSTVHEPGRK